MDTLTDMIPNTIIEIEKLNFSKDDILIIKTDLIKRNTSDFYRFVNKLKEQFPDRFILFTTTQDIDFKCMPIEQFFNLMKTVEKELFPEDEESKENNN